MMQNQGWKRRLFRRWKILVPALCVLVFFAAGAAGFIKADGLGALACTAELFRDRPDPSTIIHRHRQTIAAEAGRNDLPPELLATIIYSHQAGLTTFRKFTDCSGSALGSDLSLGLAQIRVSTAADNDGFHVAELPTKEFRGYRTALLDPAQNIRIQAREVRLLLDRNNRSPRISAAQLIRDPFVMVLLMSEYRMGRQSAGRGTARIGASGIHDLGHLEKDEVYIFDRDAAEVSEIQKTVGKYLDYLYCEKGIFDPEVCRRRKG